MAKRIKIEKLQPGDIILTASHTKAGKTIRLATGGAVSHAMICVQHGSFIDSTSNGVQSWNFQREFFDDGEEILAFRLVRNPSATQIAKIIDFARSQIGTRYSVVEAARSVLPGPRPRNKRQFCSRLVARSYENAGIKLVEDQDYCTPEDLQLSPFLEELTDITEIVSADERSLWENRMDTIKMTMDAQNAILDVARSLSPVIEKFGDLDQMLQEHPEWDSKIAKAHRDSGYLDIWQHEMVTNPWRYDLELMENITDKKMLLDLREACISTIKEAYSGGRRYAVNLAHYQEMHKRSQRETYSLLIGLYKVLVKNDHLWRETARSWLLKYHPEDVKKHMERIEPHSELWFFIVDRVEPQLGQLARLSIKCEQSVGVCSSCGDHPIQDYRIINADDAMPGVPSLRLCSDCVNIRRGFGERLDIIS
ncbi:MAG: hypothetical protein KAS59_02115 [Alphaproteobacteria bacterium]|nr:hypothetical protein [Alphaproteobacteria bacterium]